jgi:uncharacterized membrane protein (DUF373 family)
MNRRPGMIDVVKKIEHAVTVALIGLLALVVVLAAVELAVTLVRDVLAPPLLFPGIDKLLDVFGRFLLVLIGIELLETMRAFAARGVVRAEVVLTVAMIAMARKIIILEADHVPVLVMLGIASLLAALSLAYRVFVRAPPTRVRTGGRIPGSGGWIPGSRTTPPPRRRRARAR